MAGPQRKKALEHGHKVGTTERHVKITHQGQKLKGLISAASRIIWHIGPD
jgi:hypothetical protein